MQFLEGSLVHWLHDSMVQWFIGSVFQWFIGSMDVHVIVYPACFKTASCPKHIFEHLSSELVHVCFLTIHTYLLYSLLKGLVRCKMHETKCRKTSVSACGNPLKSPPPYYMWSCPSNPTEVIVYGFPDRRRTSTLHFYIFSLVEYICLYGMGQGIFKAGKHGHLRVLQI